MFNIYGHLQRQYQNDFYTNMLQCSLCWIYAQIRLVRAKTIVTYMLLIVVLGSKLGNTMKIFWEPSGNIFKTPKFGGKRNV
jgi:hypothetical protein